MHWSITTKKASICNPEGPQLSTLTLRPAKETLPRLYQHFAVSDPPQLWSRSPLPRFQLGWDDSDTSPFGIQFCAVYVSWTCL